MVVVTNHRLQQIPSEWTLADIGVGAPSVAGNHLENFLYHPYKCSGIFFLNWQNTPHLSLSINAFSDVV